MPNIINTMDRVLTVWKALMDAFECVEQLHLNKIVVNLNYFFLTDRCVYVYVQTAYDSWEAEYEKRFNTCKYGKDLACQIKIQ